MKHSPMQRGLAVALAGCLLVSGCDDADDPTDPGDNPRVSIALTDAPGDVARAWVEVEEIRLLSSDGQVVLTPDEVELVELTELVGETYLLVEDEEIDATLLTEVRLIIGDAVLESASGEVYVLGDPELPDGLVGTGQLQCPSCQQSGIKVKISGGELDLPDDDDSIVLLDFDVAQTFGHRAGNSGMWVMHPVIFGILVEGDDPFASPDAITGMVTLDTDVTIPACPAGTPRSVDDFLPIATAVDLLDGDGEPIERTGVIVGTDGSFRIGGLDLGAYILGYQSTFDYGDAVLEFEATISPSNILLSDDDIDGVEYLITEATCTPAA